MQSTRTIFGYTQPTSVFQEPSYMGAFLGPCLILLTVFVLEQRAESIFFKRRYRNWWMLIIIALAVLLSNSQAILVSITATLLWGVGGGLLRRRHLIKLFALVAGALVIVGLLLRAVGIDYLAAFIFRAQYLLINILDPTGSAEVTSFANRWERMQAGLDVWRTHPLFGVGLGNMGHHTNVHDWSNSPWVQLLVEQGVLGGFLLALLFLVIFYNLFWGLRRLATDGYWRALLIAMLFLVILTAVDGFFTLNWIHPQRIFTLALASWVALQAQAAWIDERWQQVHVMRSPTTVKTAPMNVTTPAIASAMATLRTAGTD